MIGEHRPMIQISLLYFDGCPSWQVALENLQKVIEVDKLPAEIRLIKIKSPEQAQQERFLGSPSFRINGMGLWPEEREHYTLSCRVYSTPNGLKGSPSIEMLRKQLRELQL
jgi:hypothetical protein